MACMLRRTLGGTRIKRAICGAAVVAALLAVVPAAQAVRVKADGRVFGVMPSAAAQSSGAALRGAFKTGLPALASPSLAAPPGWNVQYQGGPVVHTAAPYVIYWDPSTAITSQSQGVINQYLTDAAAASGQPTDTFGVGRQYYDSHGMASAGQTFSAATQALIDHDTYPTSACTPPGGYTNCITDAQLKAELSAFISANGLPTAGSASALQAGASLPANTPVYFLIMPPTVDTCLDSSGAQCSGGSGASFAYCAYHSYYVDSNNNVVLYSDVPFSVFTASPTKGCQTDNTSAFQAPNNDHADNIVDNLSHELNEVITDPVLNAWVNSNGGDGNELADQCQTYGATSDPTQGLSADAYVPLGGNAGGQPPNGYGTLYDQLINGHQYYTQSMWSNGQVNCEMAPVPATLTPSFTTGTPVTGQQVTVDLSGTVASAGLASTTWDWGDGTTSFVPGSPTTVTHTFAGGGLYTVTLTAVDGDGNLATTSRQIRVGSNPTPVIGSLPSTVAVGVPVSFSGASSTDTNAGATMSFGWTFGDGASATGATASHSFTAPGTYTVTLTVSDSYGFSALKTGTVAVTAAALTKLTHSVRRTSAYLIVGVNAPGKLLYGRRKATVKAPGTVKLKLALTAAQRHDLKTHRKFWLRVRLVYVPSVGPKVTKSLRLRL